MRPILVIGYGNDLRGDDGIGPHLASAVAGWNDPRIEVIAVHQLVPELAEPVAAATTVIFVDAAIASLEPVTVSSIIAEPNQDSSGHQSDPASLLELARTLYERAPKAWLVAVAGEHFELGETLSETVLANGRQALLAIRQLCPPESPVV